MRAPGGKEAQAIRASGGELALDAAEALTNIKHQQVSRWAKGPADPDAYRKQLYGRAYAAAMGLDRGAAAVSAFADHALMLW